MTDSKNVPTPHAVYPLTLFDDQYRSCAVITGWLVEGLVDENTFGAALGRVVDKWRMLAGRLEQVQLENNDKPSWRVRIPLGALPKDYPTYTLTTSTSDVPLSKYTSLPLPLVSAPLPQSLFFVKNTIPPTSEAWASSNLPLTSWHITHFPSEKGEKQYSCIGFARSHGIFDGTGASFIVRALEAEMHGRKWEVPPLPQEGDNVNELQVALDDSKDSDRDIEYSGLKAGKLWYILKFAAYHFWQTWWNGAYNAIIIVPKEAHSILVDRVRADLVSKEKNDIRVSTGDILAAWLFKTIYTDGTSPNKIVHCSNMASIRYLFSSPSNSLNIYPSNAFIPMPYPVTSISNLTSTPLHELAHTFASARHSLSRAQALSAHHILQRASEKKKGVIAILPANPKAQESLTLTNIMSSRILEVDWSAAGGGRVLCGYRMFVTERTMLFTNSIGIAGRLDDGSIVLDLTLTKKRWGRMKMEVDELIASSKS